MGAMPQGGYPPMPPQYGAAQVGSPYDMQQQGQDATNAMGGPSMGKGGGSVAAPAYGPDQMAAMNAMGGAPTGKGGSFPAPDYGQMAGFAGGQLSQAAPTAQKALAQGAPAATATAAPAATPAGLRTGNLPWQTNASRLSTTGLSTGDPYSLAFTVPQGYSTGGQMGTFQYANTAGNTGGGYRPFGLSQTPGDYGNATGGPEGAQYFSVGGQLVDRYGTPRKDVMNLTPGQTYYANWGPGQGPAGSANLNYQMILPHAGGGGAPAAPAMPQRGPQLPAGSAVAGPAMGGAPLGGGGRGREAIRQQVLRAQALRG